MTNYLLAYTGDATTPDSEEAGQAVMAAWGAWFTDLGPAVVDPGNPTDASRTVGSDGSATDGNSSGISGYSVVSADSIDAASEIAKGCPHLAAGGKVEVHQIFNVM